MYCEICKKEVGVLGRHLSKTHKDINPQDYYDKFLAKPGEGYCKECGKRLKFRKISEPYRTFCCLSCANKNEEIKDKIEQTLLQKYKLTRKELLYKQTKNVCKKYNVTNISQLQEVKDKVQNTRNNNKEKISKNISKGLHNRTQKEIDLCTQHNKETKLKNHGDSNYRNEEKIKQTCLKKYGTEYVVSSDYFIHTAKRKYTYDNKQFDSSWEIAYYIWLKDNNKKFEFHPKHKLIYEFNGVKHKYCPDFLIENLFVEIKGPHYFAKMMIENTQENAKYKCMLENNVKIITDCSTYLKYIEDKYGKNFLKQFKND